MSDTPNLDLPQMAQNTLQPSVSFNEAMQILDAIVVLVVQDKDLTAPPTTVTADAGKRWIVGAAATGAWAGHDNEIAICTAADLWTFFAPKAEFRARVVDEGKYYRFNGTAWLDDSSDGAVPEAPADGTLYGRENGEWVEIPAPGGGGTVTSVNSQMPDEAGDVTLGAADIGFTPSTESGIEATEVEAALNELGARPSGGGVSPTALHDAIMEDSPRGYYTMEAATISGTTIADQSGNGHDATITTSDLVVGASALVPTDTEGRYTYLGTGPSVKIPDSLGLTPPLSSSFSVCIAVFKGGPNYGFQDLGTFFISAFGLSGELESTNYSINLPDSGITSAIRALWEYGAGANVQNDFSLAAVNSKPVMFHFTKDSVNKTATLYANGCFIEQLTYSQEPSGGTASGDNFVFGGGLCGHWAYFDQVLTPDRVAAHAKAGGFL